jgi:ABC-type sulfate transport system permease component
VTQGKVSRYSLPGFNAFNFTLENALGGGGVASLRYDPQGKALAQMLLDIPINVPAALLDNLP